MSKKSETHSPQRRGSDSDMASVPPGYLTLKGAQAWAGVSQRTIKRWIAAGLPTYQAGPRTKILVRPADIERFLTRKQVNPVDLDAIVDEVMGQLNKAA